MGLPYSICLSGARSHDWRVVFTLSEFDDGVWVALFSDRTTAFLISSPRGVEVTATCQTVLQWSSHRLTRRFCQNIEYS
jgi:hypothetical protein